MTDLWNAIRPYAWWLAIWAGAALLCPATAVAQAFEPNDVPSFGLTYTGANSVISAFAARLGPIIIGVLTLAFGILIVAKFWQWIRRGRPA